MQRRLTKQRDTILDVARTLYHPTAEEIYGRLRDRGIDIGRATVFRNAAVLSEQGYLRKLCLPDEPTRYDTDVADHNHFMCRRCGAIVDLPATDGVAMPETNGLEIDGYSVVFYGLCQTCKREKN